MPWRFVTLAAIAVVTLVVALPPAGRTAPTGARIVKVKTDVAIEKVGSDSLFPFGEPDPGELVFFRVTVTSDGPATVKKRELQLGADVFSQAKPVIRGRRGLRCEVGRTVAGHWAVRCVNSQYFRADDSLSVLLGVKASSGEDRVWVGQAQREDPTLRTSS
jgi:hypothetical protein